MVYERLTIGALAAAQRTPVTVAPSDSIEKAKTLMRLHDFSQLPVVDKKMMVKGVVSWKSIASAKSSVTTVRGAMAAATAYPATTQLLDAVKYITDHDRILICDDKDALTAIVTATDIAEEFHTQSSTYFRLAHIEHGLRHLLKDLSIDQIKAVADPKYLDKVLTIHDLSLGQYVQLVAAHWDSLGLDLDKSTCLEILGQVNQIRNHVLHFRPSAIDHHQKELLRTVDEYLVAEFEHRAEALVKAELERKSKEKNQKKAESGDKIESQTEPQFVLQ